MGRGPLRLIASQANLPEQIARQIPPVKWFAAAGHINGGVSAQVRAEANDDQAAENLRGVVNGVISLAQLQGQNDPKLTAVIKSLQLTGTGQDRPALRSRPGRDLRADGAEGQRRSRTDARSFPFGIQRRPAATAGRFALAADPP